MKTKTLITALTAAALTAGSAHAATISWTVSNISAGDGTTDVSTNGVLVDARNGGGSDATVNGVTFLAGNTVTPAGYNLFDSVFALDNISGRRGTNPTGTYASFLQLGQRSGRGGFDGTFSNGVARTTPANAWATVTFTGLTIGQLYEVQIWATDTNQILGDAGNKGLLLGDGSGGDPDINTDTMLLYEYADGPDTSTFGPAGQYATGVFAADATTQTFNVRTYNNLLTTPSAASTDHFSNGWQIRAVPEPASLALLGLGGLLLAGRRR